LLITGSEAPDLRAEKLEMLVLGSCAILVRHPQLSTYLLQPTSDLFSILTSSIL
jgi:hypothetical protein